jgi:hypothetical protein
MTRMSREFSLVLLGSGLLTAGYFMWPEEDIQKRADEQAHNRLGGNGHRTHHGGFIFIGHFGSSGSMTGTGRSPAMANVSRGGLGSTGARVSGGSGA